MCRVAGGGANAANESAQLTDILSYLRLMCDDRSVLTHRLCASVSKGEMFRRILVRTAEMDRIYSYGKPCGFRRDDKSFERIVNVPARGIGSTTIEGLQATATARNCSLWAATQHQLRSEYVPPLSRFVKAPIWRMNDACCRMCIQRTKQGAANQAAGLCAAHCFVAAEGRQLDASGGMRAAPGIDLRSFRSSFPHQNSSSGWVACTGRWWRVC